MKHVILLSMVASLFVVGCGREKSEKTPLTVYVGGTMRPVMQELAKQYTDQTGQKIEIDSAGSGELLARIEMGKEGDIYVCHDPFLDILMKRSLGIDGWTVAEIKPVIVVPKGETKIKSLADAVKPDVQLVITDPVHSTLGWSLPTIFKKAGLNLDEVKKRKNVQIFRKGSHAAHVVETGNADAAIVWNAVAYLQRERLDVVEISPQYLPTPGIDTATSATPKEYYLAPVRVTVATLGCSDQKPESQEFAEFLASPKAGEVFKRFGFAIGIARKEFEKGLPLEKE